MYCPAVVFISDGFGWLINHAADELHWYLQENDDKESF